MVWVSIIIVALLNVFWYLLWPFLSVVLIVFSFFMPRKSKKGVNVYEKILGFKMFLKATQKDRLKVLFSPKDYREVFERCLPYAMVFGVEKEWAKQFEGLYKGVPDWYGGTGSHDLYYFVRNIEMMNASVSRTFGSGPRSRGGGSSGWSGGSGFSGGGFGGGGGGSW